MTTVDCYKAKKLIRRKIKNINREEESLRERLAIQNAQRKELKKQFEKFRRGYRTRIACQRERQVYNKELSSDSAWNEEDEQEWKNSKWEKTAFGFNSQLADQLEKLSKQKIVLDKWIEFLYDCAFNDLNVEPDIWWTETGHKFDASIGDLIPRSEDYKSLTRFWDVPRDLFYQAPEVVRRAYKPGQFRDVANNAIDHALGYRRGIKNQMDSLMKPLQEEEDKV